MRHIATVLSLAVLCAASAPLRAEEKGKKDAITPVEPTLKRTSGNGKELPGASRALTFSIW